jgi:hypothetical protein
MTIPLNGIQYVSPTVSIPKKNGTVRVITNYRKINLLLKHSVSTISFSKDKEHDPFNGMV